MPELKDKHQFCKCNNCGEVFFDTNPSNQPFFNIPKGKAYNELPTIKGEDGDEVYFFPGCPTCNTDGFLKDVEREEEL